MAKSAIFSCALMIFLCTEVRSFPFSAALSSEERGEVFSTETSEKSAELSSIEQKIVNQIEWCISEKIPASACRCILWNQLYSQETVTTDTITMPRC